ncbi:MAG: SRPBCC domain-containing protein [Planctomycetota bacterium]|nr:SRPBCC domain-containing protein [Planctomycetota bacterium]
MTTLEEHTERIIETQWEIEASVADVWRALTEARWLTNWFPTEARVTPIEGGKGGSIWMGWSTGHEQFEARIDQWDENSRLKLVYADPTPFEEVDEAIKNNTLIPFPIAADFHLEAKGDSTILRLVHSGFSEDSSWDWQYHATSRGWQFELGGLKHYLEHHKGMPRFVIQTRHAFADISFDEAWQKLFSANGLCNPGAGAGTGVGEETSGIESLREGERYAFRNAQGDHFEGMVEICNPPHDFAGTVDNLNHARLRLKVDQSCAEPGTSDVTFFLSTYELPESRRAELQANIERMMKTLFGTDR